MKKIRVLIVEDNVLVAEAIEITLKKHSLDIVGICRSGSDAVKSFREKEVDLVLMDIKLDGKMDGIEAASQMLQHRAVPIIYLSDHVDHKHVKRAMNTHPANYLSKPYDEAGLVRAIEIAFNNAQVPKNETITDREEVFVLTDSQQFERVYTKEVMYLKAARSYCDVVTDKHKYTVCSSMNHVQEKFGSAGFIRVHKSYVVNSKRITKLAGNIIFINDVELKMGKEYRDELMSVLKFIK
ncbi:MAG: response regulator [Bacteroidota bacterium]